MITVNFGKPSGVIVKHVKNLFDLHDLGGRYSRPFILVDIKCLKKHPFCMRFIHLLYCIYLFQSYSLFWITHAFCKKSWSFEGKVVSEPTGCGPALAGAASSPFLGFICRSWTWRGGLLIFWREEWLDFPACRSPQRQTLKQLYSPYNCQLPQDQVFLLSNSYHSN